MKRFIAGVGLMLLAACGELHLKDSHMLCCSSLTHVCPPGFSCGYDDHCWKDTDPATCEMIKDAPCYYPNFCIPPQCGELSVCVNPAGAAKLSAQACPGVAYTRSTTCENPDGG